MKNTTAAASNHLITSLFMALREEIRPYLEIDAEHERDKDKDR
jgi:hypothetical protein